MKNLVNYVILSVAMVIAVLVIMSQGVSASQTVLFPSTTTNNTTLNTAVENESASDTNVVPVNNLNTNTQKDPTPVNNTTVNVVNKTQNTTTTPSKSQNLPQTGENDVYIVTAVGVVALAIGTIAYIKSRKYDI